MFSNFQNALTAAREVTEVAVSIAEVMEQRDNCLRQMPALGGGENMAGMEIPD